MNKPTGNEIKYAANEFVEKHYRDNGFLLKNLLKEVFEAGCKYVTGELYE